MKKSDDKKRMIRAREEYIDLIKQELLGPGSEFSIPDAAHELISSSPTSRYSIGILFPQNTYVKQDNEETIDVDENDMQDENGEDIPLTDHGKDDFTKKRTFDAGVYSDPEMTTLDEEVSMSSQYKQSSMGMTFIVRGNVDTIKGSFSFGSYRKAVVSDCLIPYEPENRATYKIPSELEHKMKYDANIGAIRLLE